MTRCGPCFPALPAMPHVVEGGKDSVADSSRGPASSIKMTHLLLQFEGERHGPRFTDVATSRRPDLTHVARASSGAGIEGHLCGTRRQTNDVAAGC